MSIKRRDEQSTKRAERKLKREKEMDNDEE